MLFHPLAFSQDAFRRSVIASWRKGINEVTNILMTSWRKGTKKKYATYVKKWTAFCRERQINCYSPPLRDGLQFLLGLFNQGLSYSTLNTARSALSTQVC